MGAVAENIDADHASVRPVSESSESPGPDQQQIAELVKLLHNKPAPIFRNTLNSLLMFRDKPNTSIPKIIEILHFDPGYAQQILSTVNSKLEDIHREEVNSLSHAVLIAGMPQVIAIGQALPVLEDLVDKQAKSQIYRCISRACHAGVQAREWLRKHGNTVSEAAFFSAQLRDTCLLSLWYHAGSKMHDLEQTSNLHTLCSTRGLLNHVARELARKANLPTLLQQSYSPESADSQLTKTVAFACDITYLVENGWYSKQISDAVEQAAHWMGLQEEFIHQKLHQHAVIAARESPCLLTRPAAARLVELEIPISARFKEKPSNPIKKQSVNNTASSTFNYQLNTLLGMGRSNTLPQKIIKFSFQILSELIVDSPLVFFLLDKTNNRLKSRSTVGFDEMYTTIIVPLDNQNIFNRLMQKQQSVWINSNTRKGFTRLLPGDLKIDVKNTDFIAMSLFIRNKPVGLFYAELEARNPASIDLYKKFIALCKTTRTSIEEVQKHDKTEN